MTSSHSSAARVDPDDVLLPGRPALLHYDLKSAPTFSALKSQCSVRILPP